MRRALIDLVQDRDLPRISVADVAERAGVSRSTFYDHYRDVHELAEAACTAMIDDLVEAIPNPGTKDTPDTTTETLLTFFAHLAEHARLYRGVLGPQGSARVIDHVRRRATVAGYVGARRATTGDDAPSPVDYTARIPHDVPAAFTAGALIGVATDWLEHGCPCSPAEMAALTRPLLVALYRRDGRPTA
ncbi:TetR/AcrR family transcriptional regulator C-terminal domain-containing protein [Nonomuraea sp. K274]|uniref:TetR/AcrR family transcriptional regulator C-terminal domain-containing protein n=1 Tax=Nonomuraea cypriaca TaxID=1187855 RepID=A0A931EXQ2_9ACTN|nr:TetR/AcrR family transcriptional regulator C-terminal domain-containing protein [Nonomuraea cypriaca]